MKKIILALSVLFTFSIAGSSLAADLEGEIGKLYQCAFPVEDILIKVDGKLTEIQWQFAPWHSMSHDMVNVANPFPADDDEDASMEFACFANSENLYFGAKVLDDEVVMDSATWWQDDAIEVYIDGGNEKAAAYDENDIQLGMVADGEGTDGVNNPPAVQIADLEGAGFEFVVVETANGWDLEAKIPLEPFGISVANGVKIGFNIHYNDDDDGADTRESKLNWSENDDNDNSYTNPQKLAELEFVNANLAIQPNGKLASTWGIIKLSQ
ncbi:sugar-binding protein [Candidatus Poribacteria bacterium]